MSKKTTKKQESKFQIHLNKIALIMCMSERKGNVQWGQLCMNRENYNYI